MVIIRYYNLNTFNYDSLDTSSVSMVINSLFGTHYASVFKMIKMNIYVNLMRNRFFKKSLTQRAKKAFVALHISSIKKSTKRKGQC